MAVDASSSCAAARTPRIGHLSLFCQGRPKQCTLYKKSWARWLLARQLPLKVLVDRLQNSRPASTCIERSHGRMRWLK